MGGGMSLPRPYSASSGGNLQQGRAMQDSADRIAAMYGTLRGPVRRPHSTVGGTPGEYLGRDGGHCEQRQHNSAATHNGAHASQYSSRDSKHTNDDTESLKQSVQEQLQQLVRELEEGDDSTPPGEWRGRGRGGASRPLYASNPALHLTCPADLAGDHRSVSNADLSTATNGSFSSSFLTPNEDAVNNCNNRTMSASSMAPRDCTGRRTPLQAGGGGAASFLSRDRTGSLRGVPSPRGEWARPGGSTVRGGDSSALDALRRTPGRGGLDLHTYQRGRSDDLRHALDSLTRMDSHKPRRVSSMADGASHTSQDRPDRRVPTENCVADHRNDVDAEPSSKTAPRWPPAAATTTTSDKNNNSSSLGTSKSSSGIPVKANNSTVFKGVRTSQGGTAITNNSTTAILNNNKNTNSKDSTNSNIPRSGSDFLQPAKVYHKSKSRELTPTIEAANEKISQLNSGTLKRISPFEAYRRTKSRELPLDHTNANNINDRESSPVARLKSPPKVSPDRPTSPLEKTKTSAEKKADVTKPPAGERAAARLGGASSPQLSASLSRSLSAAKSERPTNGSIAAAKASGRVDKTTEQAPDKAQGRERESEKGEDKAKVKKTPSGDSDKPKSMYKMLTSRFNRSASFVSDNSRSATAAEDDEGGEKEDKFRLKRPSRFLKPRTEKSASKTSVCDTDDDADKPDKKPSKKLTDALNKFLGRKDPAKEEARPAGHVGNKATAPGKAPPDDDQPRKPPRAKGKKSDEEISTAQTKEDGGSECAQSVVPEANPASAPATTTIAAQPNYTLESATKSICNHLSQLENDITSRIGNMGTQEQRGGGGGGVRPGGSSSGRVAAAAAGPNISTYGLSPALANRRNGRPTNLDTAASNMEGGQRTGRAPSAPPPGRAPATKSTMASGSATAESDKVNARNPQETSSPSPPPTECTEEQRGQSEAEDESVMDRITRKSYYSKFQEKKRPKLWRANTREDMDQQLAAAKARLLKEEREEAALVARRLSSPRSPPPWDPHRPASRTSLPPEDAAALMQPGSRRGSSLQPDHLLGPLPPAMPGEVAPHPRMPSLPHDDRYIYPREPSVPCDDYLSRGARMQSSPPEDLLAGQYSRRASSMAPDDLSARPVGEPYVQDAMMAAMAAGSLAGQVAADGSLQRGEPGSREPSVGRLRSPEPTSVEESRSQAREELSRRLTHLTRLSGGSGLSGWNRGAHREGEQRPYRRTSTTGRLTGETSGPPVYRRTNTMDLPPADARARPGSEYRRHLQQDPARRHSAARWVS